MTSGTGNNNTAENSFTTYLLFALVCIASFQAGKFSTLLSIPKITLYLATGMIFGPFGVGLLSFTSARTTLSPISSIALAFICISAGAELTYSQLRPILKRILASTLAVSALVFTATLGVFIALSSPGKGLLPTSIEALPPPCREAIGGLMGAVAFSFSPAATMAMVRENRASGVFTSTLLGVTILADVLVLLVFALARGVTENECHYYDTLIPSATAPPGAAAASLPPASSATPLNLLPSSPSLTMASTAASAAAATLQAIPSSGGGGGGGVDTSLHHPSGPDLTSSLTMLLASLGVGVVVGGAIVLYLRARHPTTPLVILALGAAVFYTSGTLTLPSSPSLATPTPAPAAPPGHYTPHHLPLEPLLVCVIAGAVGINWSGMNADFLSHTLETLGPLVYIPFFTVTGAGLDLSTLAASVAFALVFAALRVACIGIALGGVAAAFASSSPPATASGGGGGGSGSAGSGSGSGSSSQINFLPLPVSSHSLGAAAANGGSGGGYWGALLAGVGGGGLISTSNPLPLTAALVTQAGVSIGLAGEIGRHFPGWGRDAETAIVSVVLINQAIGPFLCSWALKVSGDAGKDVGGVGGGGGVGEGVEDGGKEGPGGAVTLVARLGELTLLGFKSGNHSPESPSSK